MIDTHSSIKLTGIKREQLEVAAKKLGLAPEDLLNIAHSLDPTKEKKFEVWLMKQLSFGNIKVYAEGEKVFKLLSEFISLSNKKQLKERDINQYPRISDLEEEISSVKGIQISEGNSGKLQEFLEVKGISIFAQNTDWLILRIDDPEAAVKLSSGTKWCTSKLESAEHYLSNSKGLYVVFQKAGENLQKSAMFSGNFAEVGNLKDETITKLSDTLLSLLKEYFLQEFNFVKKFGNAGEIYTYLEAHNPFSGGLDLRGSQVQTLPENFSIEHNLFLTDTSIKELPKGLFVGGSAYLNGTGLTSLPADIRILGAVWGENFKTGISYQEEYDSLKRLNV